MKSGILSRWFVVLVCACAAVAAAEPARVIYVDAGAKGTGSGSSWADACNSLQDALAAATEKPVEIRVAKGVYKPDQGAGITPGDRTATFKLANGVTIKGGYGGFGAPDPNARDVVLHESILSGDLAGNDNGGAFSAYDENSLHVVTGSGTDHSAVIDGFTITAGSTFPQPSASSTARSGGGLLIDAGSPTVLNCCFRDNSPRANEVLLATNGSHPIVTDCSFLNNQGKGMGCVNKSNPIVTNCRFEGNESGSMSNQDSSPVITGCQFAGSRRYEIQAVACNSILTDCVFTGGDNPMGQGIHCIGGRATLTGCTFTGFRDGAMETPDEELTLVRCTFTNNSGFLAGAVRGFSHSLVTALDCTFVGNDGFLAGAIYGGDMRLHDCEFIGNSGDEAGAVVGGDEVFVATGCVFAGNSSRFGGGAISSSGEVMKVSNCTFVGNRGKNAVLGDFMTRPVPVQLTQCIVRDGPQPLGEHPLQANRISVTYSNVLGGYPGDGNIDVDPCFVDPGYWADPNDLTKQAASDDPNAVWIAGDCHLKSQAGHWDRASESWVRDEVTSLCIDAGDPNTPLGVEPFPNGGFINLGAYGGTAEASKSYFGKPVCEIQIAGDINGDCIVDQADLDILQLHWLMEASAFVNSPPTVTLLSPKDDDELTEPTPILYRSAASDSDGTILRVKYTLEYRTANGRYAGDTTVTDPTNGWDTEWPWSLVRYEGTYTIWAEVMDNEGTKTISPKIRVTLHPAP